MSEEPKEEKKKYIEAILLLLLLGAAVTYCVTQPKLLKLRKPIKQSVPLIEPPSSTVKPITIMDQPLSTPTEATTNIKFLEYLTIWNIGLFVAGCAGGAIVVIGAKNEAIKTINEALKIVRLVNHIKQNLTTHGFIETFKNIVTNNNYDTYIEKEITEEQLNTQYINRETVEQQNRGQNMKGNDLSSVFERKAFRLQTQKRLEIGAASPESQLTKQALRDIWNESNTAMAYEIENTLSRHGSLPKNLPTPPPSNFIASLLSGKEQQFINVLNVEPQITQEPQIIEEPRIIEETVINDPMQEIPQRFIFRHLNTEALLQEFITDFEQFPEYAQLGGIMETNYRAVRILETINILENLYYNSSYGNEPPINFIEKLVKFKASVQQFADLSGALIITMRVYYEGSIETRWQSILKVIRELKKQGVMLPRPSKDVFFENFAKIRDYYQKKVTTSETIELIRGEYIVIQQIGDYRTFVSLFLINRKNYNFLDDLKKVYSNLLHYFSDYFKHSKYKPEYVLEEPEPTLDPTANNKEEKPEN